MLFIEWEEKPSSLPPADSLCCHHYPFCTLCPHKLIATSLHVFSWGCSSALWEKSAGKPQQRYIRWRGATAGMLQCVELKINPSEKKHWRLRYYVYLRKCVFREPIVLNFLHSLTFIWLKSSFNISVFKNKATLNTPRTDRAAVFSRLFAAVLPVVSLLHICQIQCAA